MRALLALFLLLTMEPLLAAADAAAREGQHAYAAVVPGDYPYQLFLPSGYQSSGKAEWPLVIFLHGSGERGADVERVTVNGPPKIVADHPGTPFVLLTPLLEADGDWNTVKLERLLTKLRRDLRIDQHRIYLTGLSRGGHASWRWAAERPDLFAALVPVAGRGDPAVACRLKDLPVWAFHGDNDDIVPPSGSFAMVEAIRSCRGAASPRLTIYPGTNHGSWVSAYDDPALYRWLLEQRRVLPAPPL